MKAQKRLKSMLSVICPDLYADRLIWEERAVLYQMNKELRKDNLFSNLGQQRQARNRSV